MKHVAQNRSGVIVVLRKHEEASELLDRISRYQMTDRGVHLPEAVEEDDAKTFGLGAQILADLGVSQLRVIGSHWKLNALSGFGLEVIEYIDKEKE
jgi:3,4-dihydroxy 2-butanone 4-phosphate synthase/GTP cyclohydrolase II